MKIEVVYKDHYSEAFCGKDVAMYEDWKESSTFVCIKYGGSRVYIPLINVRNVTVKEDSDE